MRPRIVDSASQQDGHVSEAQDRGPEFVDHLGGDDLSRIEGLLDRFRLDPSGLQVRDDLIVEAWRTGGWGTHRGTEAFELLTAGSRSVGFIGHV
jgi:hypothetical protein